MGGLPSNSTWASAAGAGVTVLFIMIVTNLLHWKVEASDAAILSGGAAAALGYFFSGGKRGDTQ